MASGDVSQKKSPHTKTEEEITEHLINKLSQDAKGEKKEDENTQRGFTACSPICS